PIFILDHIKKDAHFHLQNTTLGYNIDVISPFNHGNLSQSKESLNSLLCIADSFYELNSIQVNWIKSTLLSPFKNQNAVHFQLPTSALNLIPA
ncbi:14607_t:CDS:2, partial [Funneliformis geosporum]